MALFSINTNLRMKSTKRNKSLLRASLIISINLKNKPANKIMLKPKKMRTVVRNSTYFIAYSVNILYRKKKKKQRK